MRLRLRGPLGTSTVTLGDTATVADLLSTISESTKLPAYDIKYGYPPRALDLTVHDNSTLLSKLPIGLHNEQLTITAKDSLANPDVRNAESSKTHSGADRVAARAHGEEKKKIALQKQARLMEVPEVQLPDRDSLLVLRVMPDDNSCLFRAFGKAVLPGDDLTMHELRSLVAEAIQADPVTYSQVVLEQKPDDYCRWIKDDNAWGGAIEIGILANHFEVEVCSIDVQSLRVDFFTPNSNSNNRILLVYSGIHYDTLVMSPYTNAPPDFDKAMFARDDDQILLHAKALCEKLQAQHYFTDTGGMAIRCEDCGTILRGQGQAGEHAERFGHWNMQEVRTAGG